LTTRTIWLHRAAPQKPAAGLPCNGCGVCCASAPCPIGMLFSGRISGRCSRLRFDAATSRYRCALLADSPVPPARWTSRATRRAAVMLVWRWIGAGRGCDSTVEACSSHRAMAG
jgi:hypothetical protein